MITGKDTSQTHLQRNRFHSKGYRKGGGAWVGEVGWQICLIFLLTITTKVMFSTERCLGNQAVSLILLIQMNDACGQYRKLKNGKGPWNRCSAIRGKRLCNGYFRYNWPFYGSVHLSLSIVTTVEWRSVHMDCTYLSKLRHFTQKSVKYGGMQWHITR